MTDKGRRYRNKTLTEVFEELGPVTPQQIAVIIGLLTRVLRVRAVLLDVEQNVQIILEGKLVKNKNMQELLAEIDEEDLDTWISALQSFNSNRN